MNVFAFILTGDVMAGDFQKPMFGRMFWRMGNIIWHLVRVSRWKKISELIRVHFKHER